MACPPMMLVKRKLEIELMPPPPITKRIKRPTKTLDEDTYSEALSHIIARDYFPGLLELDSQEEYLDALRSKDDDWIESAGRKLTAAMTPRPGRRRRMNFASSASFSNSTAESPRNNHTPGTVSSVDSRQTHIQPKIDVNLSLNGFLSKYTSEDAESFNKVLDRHNQKKAEKHAWLWNENKILEPRQIAYRERQQKLLQQDIREAASDGKVIRTISGIDERPAGPQSWKHVGKNTFMFPPEGIEDEMQTRQQKAEETSRAAPKRVVFENTRLTSQFSGAPLEETVPPSPTLSALKDAIAGRPRIPPSEGGYDGSETPRVNGYAFVDSEEPEPEPISSHKSDWSQLSFGHLDAIKNPFSMQESSSREKLHHKMVDKVSRRQREQILNKDVKTPIIPNSRYDATQGNTPGGPILTPAGHRLLGRLGGSTPVRDSEMSTFWDTEKGKTPRGPTLRGLDTPRQ